MKRIHITQTRDEPTTLDVVGRKRTHKANKIYLSLMIMAILFILCSFSIFADGSETYNAVNAVVIDSSKTYPIVTDNTLQLTFTQPTLGEVRTGYLVTLNGKSNYENGFLFTEVLTSSSSVQNIYYINEPYVENGDYTTKIANIILVNSIFRQWITTSTQYTTWESLYEHYEIGVNVTSGNNYNIVLPFTISQFMKGEEPMTIIETVLAVFTAVGNWFATIIPNMLALFYNAETGLTVLGVLAIASLAIAVILLVLAWIVDFFKFRR